MSVVRVHKNKNFTVMSNHHFKQKKMSLKAKGLLSLMLSLPEDWNYSVSGLVTLSKDGRDSVMSALAELEEFGYLTRERMTNEKGQFDGIEYHIYETPRKELPVAAVPTSETPTQGKPTEGKRPLLNTNKSITKRALNKKRLNTKDKGFEWEEPEAVSDDELKRMLEFAAQFQQEKK